MSGFEITTASLLSKFGRILNLPYSEKHVESTGSFAASAAAASRFNFSARRKSCDKYLDLLQLDIIDETDDDDDDDVGKVVDKNLAL